MQESLQSHQSVPAEIPAAQREVGQEEIRHNLENKARCVDASF